MTMKPVALFTQVCSAFARRPFPPDIPKYSAVISTNNTRASWSMQVRWGAPSLVMNFEQASVLRVCEQDACYLQRAGSSLPQMSKTGFPPNRPLAAEKFPFCIPNYVRVGRLRYCASTCNVGWACHISQLQRLELGRGRNRTIISHWRIDSSFGTLNPAVRVAVFLCAVIFKSTSSSCSSPTLGPRNQERRTVCTMQLRTRRTSLRLALRE